MFLSLGRQSDSKQSEAFLRTIHLILSALRHHMVEANEESVRFQAELEQYSERLQITLEADEILVAAGGVVRLIEEYGVHARKRALAQQLELQDLHQKQHDPSPDLRPTDLLPRAFVDAALDGAREISGAFIAILPIDRFSTTQKRFGPEIAAEIFQYFYTHIRARLLPTDRLFHWSDGTVLAIVERPFNLDSVRAEFAQLNIHKLEPTVSVGGRSILLPLASSFAVFGADEGRSSAQLTRKIENFLLAQLAAAT